MRGGDEEVVTNRSPYEGGHPIENSVLKDKNGCGGGWGPNQGVSWALARGMLLTARQC